MKYTLLDISERVYAENETKDVKLDNKTLVKSITNIFKAKEDEANDSIEYAELFYLDYVNNYLSVDRMCEDYYISIELSNQLIRVGRMINNNK